jgi:uncharacterized membrane protein YhaH (DUF805 family)
MVRFSDAVRLGFRHYFDFRSRSTRAEYWWWALFIIVAQFLLYIVDMLIGTYDSEAGGLHRQRFSSLTYSVPNSGFSYKFVCLCWLPKTCFIRRIPISYAAL